MERETQKSKTETKLMERGLGTRGVCSLAGLAVGLTAVCRHQRGCTMQGDTLAGRNGTLPGKLEAGRSPSNSD